MTHDSQEALVARARNGDRAAMQRLVDRHRPEVMAVAMRALRNLDDAHDVTQETLIYATLQLPTLRDLTKFSAWLRQLTLTHSSTYYRRRQTRRLGIDLHELSEATVEADHAHRLTLQASFAGLKEAQRMAMLLHHVGGYSVSEAASLLEIPPNTFRSRLSAAKRHLRHELASLLPTPMPTSTVYLTPSQLGLVNKAYPGAVVLSVLENPEPWQPFSPRVALRLQTDDVITVDFRNDISDLNQRLLAVLTSLGVSVPRILARSDQGSLALCEVPRGENLSLWALGGTPHRIRLATNRAIEGLNRLQATTDGLLADAVGALLPRFSLADELAVLVDDERWNANPWLAEEGKARREWLADPWFQGALRRLEAVLPEISTPLVYTDTMFFYPQNYRIAVGTETSEDRLGWPGDPIYFDNPLVECAAPFGSLGDPLLGLAMVWVYDCYPFVHTGFVEQILWQRGVSRREFAPRLALKALQMVARDLPRVRPVDGRYYDSIRGWAQQALDWM